MNSGGNKAQLTTPSTVIANHSQYIYSGRTSVALPTVGRARHDPLAHLTDDGMSHDLDDLFRRYHQELHRFARQRLGDADMAADVVQDAFLRYAVAVGADGVNTSLESGRRKTAVDNPKSFLLRIVSNLIIDFTRQRARRSTETGHDEAIDAHPDPVPSPERTAMGRQEILHLARAIENLPPRCRQVFLMARVEGLSYPEIGQRLSISPKTVFSHLVKALALLKTAMDRETASHKPN